MINPTIKGNAGSLHTLNKFKMTNTQKMVFYHNRECFEEGDQDVLGKVVPVVTILMPLYAH